MSDPTFAAIKALLVPYAKHFTVFEDTDTVYDLEEVLPHSRTMFGCLYTLRRGVRLALYPLNVFPELRAALPASLASKLSHRYALTFGAITTAERRALARALEAAWRRVEAQRRLAPDRAFCRKLDADQTFEVVRALLGEPPPGALSVTRRTHDVAITVPNASKLPPSLAARQSRPGVLVFKTITPEQHADVAAIVAAARRRG